MSAGYGNQDSPYEGRKPFAQRMGMGELQMLCYLNYILTGSLILLMSNSGIKVIIPQTTMY